MSLIPIYATRQPETNTNTSRVPLSWITLHFDPNLHLVQHFRSHTDHSEDGGGGPQHTPSSQPHWQDQGIAAYLAWTLLRWPCRRNEPGLVNVRRPPLLPLPKRVTFLPPPPPHLRPPKSSRQPKAPPPPPLPNPHTSSTLQHPPQCQPQQLYQRDSTHPHTIDHSFSYQAMSPVFDPSYHGSPQSLQNEICPGDPPFLIPQPSAHPKS